MKKVVIVGATGSVGRAVTSYLQEKGNYELTLFSRHAGQLKTAGGIRSMDGSVYNEAQLDAAVRNQDAVFVALTGSLKDMAESVVQSMKRTGVKQVIFISSMGIYNEIPARIGSSGNLENNPVLQDYRDGADIIETSGLAYTIIRPGWFDNGNDIYTISRKGEEFGGHDVSRRAIADLVYRILENPNQYIGESLGIHRPQ